MINLFEFQIFKDNESTLKETSKDDSDKKSIQYMVNSLKKVIDFDGVKNDYIKNMKLRDTPKSNDVLCEHNGELYFIEFKNGNMKKEIFNVRRKIFDSLLMFTDIIQKGVSFTRENVKYILVYNKEKNYENSKRELKKLEKNEVQESFNLDKISEKLSNLGNKERDRFGLSKQFEKIYFKKVHTYNQEEFNEKFVKQFETKL